MTDSIDDKTMPRQPRFNPQNEDFDFDSMAVDQESPGSLEQVDGSLMPSAQPMTEIKTSFYVDYFDKRKKTQTTSPEPVLAAEVDQSSTIDQENQDSMTSATSPSQPVHTEDSYLDHSLDSHAPVVNSSGLAVAVLSQFKSKQESINKQQEKQIQDVDKKIKTAKTVTYTSLFFGIVSLAAAAVLGLMLLETKTELSDLAGKTIALKDDLRNTKTSPDDLEGTDPSLDQVNQRIDDVVEELHEVAALQNKASRTEKTVIASNKSQDNEVDVAEKKPSAEAIIKAASITKAVKNINAGQTQATAVSATTAKAQNVSKSANKPAVPPKKDNESTDVPANDINNIGNPAATNNTPRPQPASGGWTVNLASSNKLEDAKKTANNFAQKGIPATISSVTVKNETRYRLQVKGFKSKEEATAYANKAKDALKLNSVWINP